MNSERIRYSRSPRPTLPRLEVGLGAYLALDTCAHTRAHTALLYFVFTLFSQTVKARLTRDRETCAAGDIKMGGFKAGRRWPPPKELMGKGRRSCAGMGGDDGFESCPMEEEIR